MLDDGPQVLELLVEHVLERLQDDVESIIAEAHRPQPQRLPLEHRVTGNRHLRASLSQQLGTRQRAIQMEEFKWQQIAEVLEIALRDAKSNKEAAYAKAKSAEEAVRTIRAECAGDLWKASMF